MNIATITLILGWRIIPVAITLILFYYSFGAVFSKKPDGCFGIIDSLVVLVLLSICGISWTIYLAIRLLFGIV